MINKRQFVILILLLLLPWLNVLYSLYADNSSISDIIPTNKCVELVKIKYNKEKLFAKKTNPSIKIIENDIPKVEEKEGEKEESIPAEKVEKNNLKEKKPLKKLLIVGDSLGEGLYLAYYKKIKREKRCLKVKFFVKHSTTTRNWMRNERFLKELASKKYDTVLVVLGANEFATDKASLYYNINKFLIKLKKVNPDIQIFWVVPPVPNKNLRKYVEECLGENYTIAIDDFLKEIPLSRDNIHPDIKREGYTKLWHIVLNKLTEYREINCLK
ncbi:MAG: hypothetical protein DSY60_05045 [Persephonella sp.]|nr:MAG: hypothetical protein DSY60_05045 [Persephonella sp.]